MDKTDLIASVRTYCMENANAENALKSNRYFKEAINSYGLTTPQITNKTKDLLKSGQLSLPTVLQAAPELLKSEKFEEISFGLLLINGFEKQYTKPLFDEIGTWFAFSIHNWAHADTLGMFVLPKFTKNNIIQLEDFNPWLIPPYKFQRRCIPVTLIKSLKTSPDFNSFFQFIEPLVMDPEREVHQGVGWFLREAWKKKREETEAFLLKWKDRAPRLIIQYATEKMTSEEKLRFRRVK